jgi:hypothetical protein
MAGPARPRRAGPSREALAGGLALRVRENGRGLKGEVFLELQDLFGVAEARLDDLGRRRKPVEGRFVARSEKSCISLIPAIVCFCAWPRSSAKSTVAVVIMPPGQELDFA